MDGGGGPETVWVWIGEACWVGVSAGVCWRPPGAGATVVVGSYGAACDTWAFRRAVGASTARTATFTMIFFTIFFT